MNIKAPIPVTVSRDFAVPPARLFDAWLDPAFVGRWMFGPPLRDEEVLNIKIDARIGGRFSFLVRRQGQEIDHVGAYLEFDRPRRLAFTWGTVQDGASSRVVIDIAPAPAGAVLTLTHEIDPDWASYADRIRESWSKMLASLANRLA